MFSTFAFTTASTISFFFFNDTATTEIYTLSLHDALPICDGEHRRGQWTVRIVGGARAPRRRSDVARIAVGDPLVRAERVAVHRGRRWLRLEGEVLRRGQPGEVSGTVVSPHRQIERAQAGDDVDVTVVVEIAGDDADELIAGRAIDRRGKSW